MIVPFLCYCHHHHHLRVVLTDRCTALKISVLHRDESGIALASSWTRLSQVRRGRPGGLVQLVDGFLPSWLFTIKLLSLLQNYLRINSGTIVNLYAAKIHITSHENSKQELNRYSTRHISPVSEELQFRLVSGWGLQKRRSTAPYGPCGSGRTFALAWEQDVRSKSVPNGEIFLIVSLCLFARSMVLEPADVTGDAWRQ